MHAKSSISTDNGIDMHALTDAVLYAVEWGDRMLILYTAYAMQGWIDRILIIRDGREIFLFFLNAGHLCTHA